MASFHKEIEMEWHLDRPGCSGGEREKGHMILCCNDTTDVGYLEFVADSDGFSRILFSFDLTDNLKPIRELFQEMYDHGFGR